jgi:HAD superfamily phosphatase
MAHAIIWKRPNLQFPQPFDTIFFDVDGILIKTIASFHATDIAVAEYIAGTVNGLDWGQRQGKPLVTIDDVNLFKQAGGYNNDWDMCYLLSALFTARLREWRGTPLAERSIQQWAALSREANLRGHGGTEWVRQVTPITAQPDYNLIGNLYHEIYWGADEFTKRYGRASRYLPNATGFVHREEILIPADLPIRLREAGIRHMGMITGRVGPEVDSALERLEAYSGERWWEVVISADICPKPDPRAMRLAIESVGTQGGLYIGDTADDLDLV